jgi:uncharacterized protein
MSEPSPVRPVRRAFRRTRVIRIVLVLAALVWVVRFGASLFTERLWFRSVGAGDVWTRQTTARLGLAFVSFVVSALVVWFNLLIADRAAVGLRTAGPHRSWTAGNYSFGLAGRLERPQRWALSIGAGLVISPIIGSRWQDLLLFLYGGSTEGPRFGALGMRADFFMFTMPFVISLTAWLTTLIVVSAAISIVSYSMSGALRRIDQRFLMAQGANTHLSILLSVFAVCMGVAMWWGRYGLAVGTRGDFVGLLYTDHTVRAPAYAVLALAAAIVAGAAISNIRVRNWTIPTVGVGCWIVVAIITLGIAPAVVQAWTVNPNQPDYEGSNLDDNVAATMYAYGLESMASTPSLNGAGILTEQQAETAARTVRLWDPTSGVLLSQVRSAQEARYYQFGDVDIDRYVVDGRQVLTGISAREVDPSSEKGWVNQVLKYTHGYGAVVVNAGSAVGGNPDYLVKSFDFAAQQPTVTHPRLYFGQDVTGYSITGTTSEFVHDGDATKPLVATGIKVSGGFRRMAFAIRLGDLDVIRGRGIDANSRLVMRRNVIDRARTLAPFLRFDSDPYPVVLNGRILWVVDAFTTSDRFPAAQRHSLGAADLTIGSELISGFNYIRNSVRVVVDAESGETQMYRTDTDDAVADLWSKAFPTLFRPASKLSTDHPGLASHLRYPADLLSVQSSIFGTYHQASGKALLSGEQRWEPSPNVDSEISDAGTRGASIGSPGSTRSNRAGPLYRLVSLPGQTKPGFTLTQTLEKVAKTETGSLTAMLSGRVDQMGRNELSFTQVTGRLPSMTRAASNMASDPSVSALQTQLSQKGSRVILGAMQLVTVGRDRVVYVRPMYTLADSADAPARLVDVLVYDADRVSVAPTASAAFAALVGNNAPSTVVPTDGAPNSTDPRQVLADAARKLAAAKQRLKVTGDVVEYEKSIESILESVRRADQTLAAISETTTSISETTTSISVPTSTLPVSVSTAPVPSVSGSVSTGTTTNP